MSVTHVTSLHQEMNARVEKNMFFITALHFMRNDRLNERKLLYNQVFGSHTDFNFTVFIFQGDSVEFAGM